MNILITGASRGIGFYTALQFAKKKGHKIFVLSRNVQGMEQLLSHKEIVSEIIFCLCDLTDEKSVVETVNKIKEETNGLEILINNAGTLINKPFEALKVGDWETVYRSNVFGLVNLTRLLLPLLKRGTISEDGNVSSHIINISSMGGVQGSSKFKGLSAYSSSKAAIIGVSECLSEELKEDKIFVNCLALGSVNTEMFQQAFPGVEAGVKDPSDLAIWITEFAMNGYRFFNGKVIPVSSTVP